MLCIHPITQLIIATIAVLSYLSNVEGEDTMDFRQRTWKNQSGLDLKPKANFTGPDGIIQPANNDHNNKNIPKDTIVVLFSWQ